MRTATLYAVSALFWIGGALFYEQPVVALFLAFAHMISWQVHALEVRVNKLLDQHGLYVTNAEVRE